MTDAASQRILLADIGGTNARFALLGRGRLGTIASFQVEEFAGIVPAARTFLARDAKGRAPVAAAIAAAGPVEAGRVRLTNAPWVIDSEELRAGLGLRLALVINDFAALAWALPELGPGDIHKVGKGKARDGAPRIVLGPGTGFGLAALLTTGSGEIALITEGGHATLAAGNRREDAVIQLLRERLGHVSIERVLSGEGLVQLYEAVAKIDGLEAPARGPAEIEAHALSGDCPASRAALDLFCELLGSVAGNAALTLGARGGVYIAGGIVPRFVEFFARSGFRRRFEAKGRFARYLEGIPTAVVTHGQPAFLGLARLAKQELKTDRAARKSPAHPRKTE